MKAIRTKFHRPSNAKPSRISATTGEKGQRIIVSKSFDWSAEKEHGRVARMLADKFNWPGKLIGGGFPDGTMVWVFADSEDVA